MNLCFVYFPTVSVEVVRFSSVTSFSSSPLLRLPIGDDGQLMSSASYGPPVL